MKHCSTIDASTIDARWRRKKGPSDLERHDGLASSRDSLCHPVLHPRPICHGQLTKPIRHNLLNSVSFGPQLQSSVDSDIGDRAALLPNTAAAGTRQRAWCVSVDRDENGRKQLAKDSTIFTFIFFLSETKAVWYFRK